MQNEFDSTTMTGTSLENSRLLYHGSTIPVPDPGILVRGFYKDFGYGFYCTHFEKQAQRWALSKKDGHVVSVYQFSLDSTMKILTFNNMTEEWLDFVVACRRGISHEYDIVEGPMADDQIWDYVEDFINGKITREAFWVLVKFKNPTHQIAFCSERPLQTIQYERSYPL